MLNRITRLIGLAIALCLGGCWIPAARCQTDAECLERAMGKPAYCDPVRKFCFYRDVDGGDDGGTLDGGAQDAGLTDAGPVDAGPREPGVTMQAEMRGCTTAAKRMLGEATLDWTPDRAMQVAIVRCRLGRSWAHKTQEAEFTRCSRTAVF